MGKRHALLIGVPEYDKEAIPNLPVVHNDIRDLASVLERSKYTVRKLGTGGGDPASRNNTRGAIEDALSEAGTGDTLLVYFSGHGAHYDGKDWLVPSDGRITGPKFHDYLVHLDFASFVENSKAGTVLFFIDACRGVMQMRHPWEKIPSLFLHSQYPKIFRDFQRLHNKFQKEFQNECFVQTNELHPYG